MRPCPLAGRPPASFFSPPAVPIPVPGFANRMERIRPSATVALSDLVARKRAEGTDIVSFSVGEPDFTTPEHVRQAAKDALDAGHTRYSPGAGIPELREAVALRHNRDNDIPCGPRHVLVTPTKHAVAMSLLAVADQGDAVLVPDPGWVSYEPIVQWAHAKPVPVPLSADGFSMTPDAVNEARTPDTRAVVLNSPSNPTGGVTEPDHIRGIVEIAEDHDLWIVSDEIYQSLIYGDTEHLSPGSLAFDRTITIDGLSKSFAMTGWRIGWLVAPEAARREIGKLQSHTVTHCTTFAQHGGLAALQGPQDFVQEMRSAFAERRCLLVDGLRKLPGVECAEPQGAFYAFPRFDAEAWGGRDDKLLAEFLVEEAGVAAVPGSAFGELGRDHLRFSYATSAERILEGLRRVAQAHGRA